MFLLQPSMNNFVQFLAVFGVLLGFSFAQGPVTCIVEELAPHSTNTIAIGASFSMSVKVRTDVICNSKEIQVNGARAAIHDTAFDSTTYTPPWNAARLFLQNSISGSVITLNITLKDAQASDIGTKFRVAAGGGLSVEVALENVTYCGNVVSNGVKQDVPVNKTFMSNHTFSCMDGFDGIDQFAVCQANAMWNLTLPFCFLITTSPPASSDLTTNPSMQTSNQTTTTSVAVSTPSSTTDVTADTTMPVTDSGPKSLEGWKVALVAVGTCAGITIIVFVGLFCVISKKYPEETTKWKICAVCTCVLCVGGDGICGRCCCCCVNCSVCTCCCCCFAMAAKRRGRKNSSKVSPRNSQSDMTANAKHV